MHARIDHLLSLRDGEPVDIAVRAHVEACAECAQEQARLEFVRRRLNALPGVSTVPAAGWETLRARLDAVRSPAAPPRWQGAAAIAASFAMLSLLAGMLLREAGPDASERVAAQEPAGALLTRHSIEELQGRSRVLEEVLAALPERPAVERAGTAIPIETLEAQVQWLDHQLSVSGVADAPPALTEELWRERVELMNTLVQLRYVEAQRVAL
jgi:hypothetical protein